MATFNEQLTISIVDKLLIGLILLLAGWWGNRNLEVFKTASTRQSQIVTAQVNFIDKQLADFYWPLSFRLEKDNAVWGKILDKDKTFAKQIEQEVILPNHKAILTLVDEHSNLAFNAQESIQPEFVEALKAYQRHVAVYQALRSTGQTTMPESVGEPWPTRFGQLVQERIKQLQTQRARLLN